MEDHKILDLLDRYLIGNCTDQENALVERFYLEQAKDKGLPSEDKAVKLEIWHGIQQETQIFTFERPKSFPFKKKYIAVAASIIFLLGTIYTVWIHKYNNLSEILPNMGHHASTHTSGTILTLGDGKKIVLSDEHHSIRIGDAIAYEDGQDVVQLPANQILSVETSAGNQYQMILADGTKVWLNAKSKLIYPSYFGEEDREVELIGEGYFEVATRLINSDGKITRQPFRVKFANQTLDVLGTKFNISAYSNDTNSKTSLLEGKVALRTNRGTTISLAPGQQAVFREGDSGYQLKTGMGSQAIAWTQGRFDFEGLSFVEAVAQIERWYDIEVIYQNKVPDIQLFGDMDRTTSLEGVIKLMRSLGLHVKKDGKKLYVSVIE